METNEQTSVSNTRKRPNDDSQEFQKTILEEIRSLKAEFKEINKNQKEDFASIRSDIAELKNQIEELRKLQKSGNDLPIRETIIGEWEMVSYENFREYNQTLRHSFEKFSEPLKFKLENGRLIQVKTESILREGVVDNNTNELFMEKNHLKSIFATNSTVDRYIQDGKLHYVNYEKSCVFKRVYKRV